MLPRRSGREVGEDSRLSDQKSVSTKRRHNLTLKGREHLSIEGVRNVESFDRSEVLLETDQGYMIVKGEDLHIKELNIEGSGLVIIGFVHSMAYQSEGFAKQSKGFFGRLFK